MPAARLIHFSTDENTDLHKQIGCMNGFFHLFDRYHFLGGLRSSSHNHKRLPSGQNANNGMQLKNATQKATLQERNPPKESVPMKEKQRVSIESSRPSFSSSCTSTFSSVDYNKTTHLEPSSMSQSIYHEAPSYVSTLEQLNSSSNLHPQNLELQDLVKGSIYREAHRVSVKTMGTEEGTRRVIRHVDSPRPLRQSNSVQHFNESNQATAKLRQVPLIVKEQIDNYLPLAPKDTPRFSYDERESRDTLKSALKLKEFPRLSLDSRGNSTKGGSASESRADFLLRDFESRKKNSGETLSLQEEPGSNKRPSNVVAKLMGLETLPDLILDNNYQITGFKSSPNKDFETISRSPRKAEQSRSYQDTMFPRVSHKAPTPLQLRKADSVMKPTPSSRFPLEPAPWRQSANSSKDSQKPAPTKTPHAGTSVYGEIQKRLAQLEFRKSGKDLRALKQILEAIQKTREKLEGKNDEQTLYLDTERPNNQQTNHPTSTTLKRAEKPFVIIQSAKLVDKTRSFPVISTDVETAENKKHWVAKGAKNPIKNNRPREVQSLSLNDRKTIASASTSTSTLKATQQMTDENHTSSERSAGSVSPRLPNKKKRVERQPRPTTESNDSRRPTNQSRPQPIESVSPRKQCKSKSTNSRHNLKQVNEINRETRDLSHQGDTLSARSESNSSSSSQIYMDVTSTDHSDEINCRHQQKDPKHSNPASTSSENLPRSDFAILAPEQPSPVSVLDATFYREGSPSPVKKMSHAFRDDETVNSDEVEWNSVDLDHLLKSTTPNLSSEFNHEHLVCKLRFLNSIHDEATRNEILIQWEKGNPEQRYITEILLASGLLGDIDLSLTPFRQHPSGYLINPNLFQVLELTNGPIEPANDKQNENITLSKFKGKIHRKLVFDTVNEILIHKFAPAASELWVSPYQLSRRSLNRQKLLKELLSEMDILQAYSDNFDKEDGFTSILSSDIMHQSENWAFYRAELPAIVLEIERLIFKDLVTEVARHEMTYLQGQPNKHFRQLFPM